MHTGLLRCSLRSLGAGLWGFWGAACIAVAAVSSVPAAQATIDALAKANAAVVGVRVSVEDGARSAETLGQRRSGSGVVIGPDGLILTIGYLVVEAQSIEIVTQDQKTLPAQAVAYDLATGFGLIRPILPLRGIQPVQLGSLQELRTGEPLMASTGPQPGGEDADVNMVQVVSQRPFSGYWEYHIDIAIFTSPPVGNHSGAAIFNQKGELMGIGSLLVGDALGRSPRIAGNMFVPVDLLKPILAELQSKGSSQQSHRPWVGLTSSEQAGRVQILRVSKESPAAEAGLEAGDVVLAVNGVKVRTLEGFYKKLWDHAQAEVEIQFTVLQGADIKTIVIKAVDRMNTMRKPTGI